MNIERALCALEPDRPLPGTPAHELMLPGNRRAMQVDPERGSWREAAVLILLYPMNGSVHFPLMRRPEGAGHHAGQVSLPGGSLEPGETYESCALRETQEELGVPPRDVVILRELSGLHVPPSRFSVRPFVGYAARRPDFQLAPLEVAALVDIDIDRLVDPGARFADDAVLEGHTWRIPYFMLSGWRVWGATAMILAELGALLAEG